MTDWEKKFESNAGMMFFFFKKLLEKFNFFSKKSPDDTILDLKKLIAVQTGTKYDKIRLQKWYNIFKDHITLQDYEIHDGMGLEMYYN